MVKGATGLRKYPPKPATQENKTTTYQLPPFIINIMLAEDFYSFVKVVTYILLEISGISTVKV